MGDPTTRADSGVARMRPAEDALRKVQAQAAALEELSEQLSLSVHVLEAEIAGLGEQMRADVELRSRANPAGDTETGAGIADEDPRAGEPTPPRSTDGEGARLVALNMALDGEPRESADRYLEEHFDIPERARLLDEVYAAAGR